MIIQKVACLFWLVFCITAQSNNSSATLVTTFPSSSSTTPLNSSNIPPSSPNTLPFLPNTSSSIYKTPPSFTNTPPFFPITSSSLQNTPPFLPNNLPNTTTTSQSKSTAPPSLSNTPTDTSTTSPSTSTTSMFSSTKPWSTSTSSTTTSKTPPLTSTTPISTSIYQSSAVPNIVTDTPIQPYERPHQVHSRCSFTNDIWYSDYNNRTSQRYLSYANNIFIRLQAALFRYFLRLLSVTFITLSQGSVVANMSMNMASNGTIPDSVVIDAVTYAFASAFSVTVTVSIVPVKKAPIVPPWGIALIVVFCIALVVAIIVISTIICTRMKSKYELLDPLTANTHINPSYLELDE